MDGRSTARARTALLPAFAVLALAALAPATAGGQGSTVIWQGATPDSGTAYAAGVGREFRLPLEAAGSLGSTIRIRVNQLPAGARLVRLAEAPVRVDFRWRPSARQRGEWRFVFTAGDGTSSAGRITVRVHVGRTASRSFRLSSRTLGGSSHNAVLKYAVAARSTLTRPTGPSCRADARRACRLAVGFVEPKRGPRPALRRSPAASRSFPESRTSRMPRRSAVSASRRWSISRSSRPSRW